MNCEMILIIEERVKLIYLEPPPPQTTPLSDPGAVKRMSRLLGQGRATNPKDKC